MNAQEMKKNKHAILEFLVALSAGLILGLFLWLAGNNSLVLLCCPLGFGLFYLHMRWLKNVNKSENGPKLKQFT